MTAQADSGRSEVLLLRKVMIMTRNVAPVARSAAAFPPWVFGRCRGRCYYALASEMAPRSSHGFRLALPVLSLSCDILAFRRADERFVMPAYRDRRLPDLLSFYQYHSANRNLMKLTTKMRKIAPAAGRV